MSGNIGQGGQNTAMTLVAGTSNVTITQAGFSATIGTSAVRTIALTIDGGGVTPGTGMKGFFRFSYPCTIKGVYLMADQVGSVVIDIWKVPFASFPPTVANTITASDLPTISSAQSYSDTALTGWTTTVAAGDVIAVNVNSITTITRLNVDIVVQTT